MLNFEAKGRNRLQCWNLILKVEISCEYMCVCLNTSKVRWLHTLNLSWTSVHTQKHLWACMHNSSQLETHIHLKGSESMCLPFTFVNVLGYPWLYLCHLHHLLAPESSSSSSKPESSLPLSTFASSISETSFIIVITRVIIIVLTMMMITLMLKTMTLVTRASLSSSDGYTWVIDIKTRDTVIISNSDPSHHHHHHQHFIVNTKSSVPAFVANTKDYHIVIVIMTFFFSVYHTVVERKIWDEHLCFMMYYDVLYLLNICGVVIIVHDDVDGAAVMHCWTWAKVMILINDDKDDVCLMIAIMVAMAKMMAMMMMQILRW